MCMCMCCVCVCVLRVVQVTCHVLWAMVTHCSCAPMHFLSQITEQILTPNGRPRANTYDMSEYTCWALTILTAHLLSLLFHCCFILLPLTLSHFRVPVQHTHTLLTARGIPANFAHLFHYKCQICGQSTTIQKWHIYKDALHGMLTFIEPICRLKVQFMPHNMLYRDNVK